MNRILHKYLSEGNLVCGFAFELLLTLEENCESDPYLQLVVLHLI